MGIDTEFVAMVGVKKEYNWLKCYKSKNDKDYTYDLENGDIYTTHVVFKDYLPDDYNVYRDSMCGEYTCIGKLLTKPVEYLDEIRGINISVDDLQKYIDEVYSTLETVKLKVDKEDIKLFVFTHFS